MNKRTTAALSALLLAPLLLTGGTAAAHGSSSNPASRSLGCKNLGVTKWPTGTSSSKACNAAYAKSGDAPFVDWMSVAQGDAAGRHRQVVPDGKLCSGNQPKFAGLDVPGRDWPTAKLPSGGEYALTFTETARHAPSHFEYYVTKDGYDPSKPLAWKDLEAIPFLVAAQPQRDTSTTWAARLPAKKGRHVVYAVWQRDLSDSDEAFYSCSDVNFT